MKSRTTRGPGPVSGGHTPRWTESISKESGPDSFCHTIPPELRLRQRSVMTQGPVKVTGLLCQGRPSFGFQLVGFWSSLSPVDQHAEDTFKVYFLTQACALNIRVEGLPRTTVIHTGQHILIEGESEDEPYVAKVLRMFGDENGEQKKAVVQWFARLSEVAPNKRGLLGRTPHPQEVFFYQGGSCDDEVDVESILRPVQVQHVDAAAPFPDSGDADTLFVKLSWDGKIFRVVDPSVMGLAPRTPPPCLPPSPPRSPPVVTPASRGPSRRALPTPDPGVMRLAASAQTKCSRATMSAGKVPAREAESLHSATKTSASKTLSAKRRGTLARTPGVRKRLALCSPEDSPPEHVLNGLLEQELATELVLSQRLTPHRKTRREPETKEGVSLKRPLLLLLSKVSVDEGLSARPAAAEDSLSPQEAGGTEAELPVSSVTTPRRRSTTPWKGAATRAQKASTPSRTKQATALREPALGVLAEVDNENSPATPRSSRRKSARMVSSLIRKQLNLLENKLELSSDEEEDDFVPSKVELQSSSEEEDEEEEEDVDMEVVVKPRCPSGSRAPRSAARTPRKTPMKKAPATPRTPRRATPSIPSRSQPARQPANLLEEARTRLHVSSVPESLPCREQEFEDIYSFVESKILDGTGGCMYISGVPGTGKTATVHEVMRCLQQASDLDQIPSFLFIEINGMKMTDPHQAYVQVLQKLTGQKATADHAAALLEKRFSNPAPRKETTVLLVDELDLLWTRKQNVMYNLFDWPSRRQARLVVLTIANTMDLPERIMINRVASRLGLTRMSFQPYSFKQLQQIITSRLNKIKAFEEDALQLVSRKVAALSGDARRCLDICRRATEICEHSATDSSAPRLVSVSHVMEALNEMFSSPYVTAIKAASLQEQLFLKAVIAEFRRLGLEEATFQQICCEDPDAPVT
ncbi:origin recognition complex subunit 1 isoform X2 [Synchiropus splendidus]|uniref:origin recognition complex subunit 1 isoform X2 n=1 Tax=Synchiropus splendidus TaxID=270530 RepID=UPI00237EBB2A|nr:origin recognition complex subunit 1 isoform X2 [Synchiropus splendidus]